MFFTRKQGPFMTLKVCGLMLQKQIYPLKKNKWQTKKIISQSTGYMQF